MATAATSRKSSASAAPERRLAVAGDLYGKLRCVHGAARLSFIISGDEHMASSLLRTLEDAGMPRNPPILDMLTIIESSTIGHNQSKLPRTGSSYGCSYTLPCSLHTSFMPPVACLRPQRLNDGAIIRAQGPFPSQTTITSPQSHNSPIVRPVWCKASKLSAHGVIRRLPTSIVGRLKYPESPCIP